MSNGHVGRALRILGLLGAAGCGEIVHNGPDGGSPSGDGSVGRDGSLGSSLPECKAQRVVYLVGGNGGFAWFTLEWPVPAVINAFQAAYAYDDPSRVGDVTSAGQISHPLYARKLGTRTLWQGLGSSPEPSAFVAGMNETHTSMPRSITGAPVSLPALGASLQADLNPVISAIAFGTSSTAYGSAPGAPAVVATADVTGGVQLFNGTITADQKAMLTPSAEQLGRFVPAGGQASETAFGSELAYAANAFKLGLATTILIPAFNDDPHGAFGDGTATTRANNLAAMLDAFYTDLAAANDPSCSHDGQPINLADNVVTAAFGDTPKNSFAAMGWGDGTPGNSNWIYLRSNGFTKPGWFGVIQSASRTNFNPTSGLADANATIADSTNAAYAASLYAIVRGDAAKVTAVTPSPYAGLILK